MARTRNLKPGFFQNELLGEMHPLTRLFFAGMWCWADRDGRLEDRPARLRGQILPFDPDCDPEEMVASLAAGQEPFLVRYEVDGRKFLQILNFDKHQNPHVNEQPSTIPAPTTVVQVPTSTMQAPCKHGGSTENVLLSSHHLPLTTSNLPLEEDTLSQGGKPGRKRFVKPTVEEVAAYCSERKNGINAEEFLDHYESNGWVVGKAKAPMKCWKATVRNWETMRKNGTFSGNGSPKPSTKPTGRITARNPTYEELEFVTPNGCTVEDFWPDGTPNVDGIWHGRDLQKWPRKPRKEIVYDE